jgi:hypothetical protein
MSSSTKAPFSALDASAHFKSTDGKDSSEAHLRGYAIGVNADEQCRNSENGDTHCDVDDHHGAASGISNSEAREHCAICACGDPGHCGPASGNSNGEGTAYILVVLASAADRTTVSPPTTSIIKKSTSSAAD